MQNILVIEDELVIRSSLKHFLEKQEYKVTEAGSIEEAVKFNLHDFSLIITDVRLPGPPGTEIIQLAGEIPVLVMTSYASMRSAIEAMKMGAADYIAKPFDYDEILETIQGLVKTKLPRSSNNSVKGMIGSCDSMKALFEKIAKVAPTYSDVLIEGESGTGKEMLASAVHLLSHRAGKEMVTLNCAAIPDKQLEAELFGFEKGAFPEAQSSKVGLIEAANNSSLFLNEIGELPVAVQAQLLSVLEEGYVKRMGSDKKRKVEIRLLVSTSSDLKKSILEERFSRALYYRINTVKFNLPPLRDRKEDLIILASTFLQLHGHKFGKTIVSFSDDSIQLLKSYSWPGNIRELKNTIEGAAILCDGSVITSDLLSIDIDGDSDRQKPSTIPVDLSLQNYFLKFVLENQNRMTETQLARQLGISRKSLWEKRQKLHIPREKSKKN